MIEDYFTDTVTLCNPTRDEWDRTTWGYTETECRLQKYERALNVNGESILAKWKLWLPYSLQNSVSVSTRVYLGSGLSNGSTGSGGTGTGGPSELPNQTYQCVEPRYEKDFDGSHLEVILG